jgi:adenylate cyclase class 2
MLEIEAKIKVEDFVAIKDRLSILGAASIGQYEETNTFFDTPARTLLAADQGLRLRRKRDLATKGEQFILTFKGPCQTGPLKTREERELLVASDTDAVALLHSLGYEQIFQFEKRREVWRLSDCEIALDEVPNLGRFVEIEGRSEAAIKILIQELALGGRPLIRESYVALLIGNGSRR